MDMSSCRMLHKAVFVVGALVLTTSAGAASLVDSVAESTTDNTETSDIDYALDSSDVPGGAALAEVNCTGGCLVTDGPIGRAKAATDYGMNRVYAHAAGGLIHATSSTATSFWKDEWTFDASGPYTGGPVSLEFRLDGSWEDARVDFDLVIFNSTPELPSGDDRPLFEDYGHPINLQKVLHASFSNTVIDGLALGFPIPGLHVTLAEGTAQDGIFDGMLTVSFTPQIGEVYTIAAGMKAFVDIQVTGSANEGTADFYQTAALQAVYLPQGLTLTTDSGAAFNVAVVPEADTWAMLLAGLGLMGLSSCRRRNWRSRCPHTDRTGTV